MIKRNLFNKMQRAVRQLSLHLIATPPRRTKVSRKQQLPPIDERLTILWRNLAAEYFPLKLELQQYRISWSRRRQKRVLGSCNIQRKRVNIARELDRPEYQAWVEAVLYHEMCHAVLGDEMLAMCGRRAWHGKAFKDLEARHPRSVDLQRWMREGGWTSAVRAARSRARRR